MLSGTVDGSISMRVSESSSWQPSSIKTFTKYQLHPLSNEQSFAVHRTTDSNMNISLTSLIALCLTMTAVMAQELPACCSALDPWRHAIHTLLRLSADEVWKQD